MGKSEKEELDKATFASFTYTGNALCTHAQIAQLGLNSIQFNSIQFKRKIACQSSSCLTIRAAVDTVTDLSCLCVYVQLFS